MQTTRLKLAFLAVVLLQPVQFAFVSVLGEPYPALIMPGFGSPRSAETGVYTTDSVDLIVEFADGTRGQASVRELLSAAPSSHLMYMLNWVFRPQESSDPERESPTKRFLKSHVLRAYAVRDRYKREQFEDEETRAWLRRRLRQMLPGREPRAAEFHWMVDTYTLESSTVERQREPLGVRRVELASNR